MVYLNGLLIVLSTFMVACYGGELTISYSPQSVRFMQATALRSSSLDDVIAVAMGYTPETSPWTGITVTSPFDSPSAAVIFYVDGSGASLQQEGHHYSLQEDIPFTRVIDELNSTVSSSSFRPIHLVHMEVADGATADSLVTSSSLKQTKEPDASFLLEVSALPTLIQKLEASSSYKHGGQDFLFFQMESFPLLVKTYGDDSPQVFEAKQLLGDAVGKLVASARKFYNDNVLVVSVVTDKHSAPHTRRRRAVGEEVLSDTDLNLAKDYSEDYPAIFNIILFLSIVLAIAVLAVSAAMAYMDPGRDSIIYRMTNPRMKKDQ